MSTKQTPQLNDQWIDPEALEIVHQLHKRNHTTYLVGGCVRDLLLGRIPKDYDIATTANPREVKRAVRNSYIIGKRFRLVLAKRGDELYEISTFRTDPKPDDEDPEAPPNDNVFGTPEEDALRRDFTINALFYDPANKKVIDYAKGLKDLKSGIVRMIGDPVVRLEEDPIRIMRGIRLSHMIGFSLEPSLRRGIGKLGHLLPSTALPRRREELLKYLRLQDPAQAFITSHDLKVLQYTTPSIENIMSDSKKAENFLESMHQFLELELHSPAELFSGLTLFYCKAAHGLELEPDVDVKKVLELPELNEFMKSELGMFNAEQAMFKACVHLISQLQRRQNFERRGERRRWTLFRNESFPLALKLAEKLYLISPEDLQYWRDEYAKRPEDLRVRPNTGKKRRRRPRKKLSKKTSSKTSNKNA